MSEHAQHPSKALEQLIIDRFKVLQVHLLVENHLVETWHEVCMEEPMMEYREAEDPTDEFEIVKVFMPEAGLICSV